MPCWAGAFRSISLTQGGDYGLARLWRDFPSNSHEPHNPQSIPQPASEVGRQWLALLKTNMEQEMDLKWVEGDVESWDP